MDINREGTHDSEIIEIIKLSHYATSKLKGVLWDKNVTKIKNRCTYNTVIKRVTTCGSEVWQIKKK
jgi:hypothetical protein